eukprot:255345-Amphidinium_carterae.1
MTLATGVPECEETPILAIAKCYLGCYVAMRLLAFTLAVRILGVSAGRAGWYAQHRSSSVGGGGTCPVQVPNH